jgi:hypothetical protein
VRLLTKQPVDREEANLLLAQLWAKVGPVASASASAADLDALRAAVAALQAQVGQPVQPPAISPDLWARIQALIDAAIAAIPAPPIQPDEQAQIWFAEEA